MQRPEQRQPSAPQPFPFGRKRSSCTSLVGIRRRTLFYFNPTMYIHYVKTSPFLELVSSGCGNKGCATAFPATPALCRAVLSTRVLRGVPAGELGERFFPVVSCWASTVDWIGSAASDTPNLRSSSCEMEITAKNDSRAAVVCAAFTVLGCHTVCRLSFCGPWTVGWPGPGPAGYE